MTTEHITRGIPDSPDPLHRRAEPSSAAALYQRGLAAYSDRRLRDAERALRMVVARRPRHAGALHFLGLVAQLSGRRRRALRLLRESIAADPRDAVYRLNLGNLLYELGRPRDAIAAWEAAARLDGRFEDAFTNIGLTCAETGEHERASVAFAQVTQINPESAGAYRRLAGSLRRLGRQGEAKLAAARATELSQDPRALARFGTARTKADRVDEGLKALRRAVRLAPGDAAIRFELARALDRAGREVEALRVYSSVLAIDSGHEAARFRAGLLRGQAPPTPLAGYVIDLFDDYADEFDRHLVEGLQSRGPTVLWRAVRRVLARKGREPSGLRTLDAGCGTGLASGLLRVASHRLVGVDLSARMIGKARTRNAYDELIVGDLVPILKSVRETFDLIFSADVFIYLGDLSEPVAAAARALGPGGLLAFTVEAGNATGYAITRSGRYAHSAAYVRQTAAAHSLTVRHAGTAAVRYEDGAPVKAAVMVLEKTGGPGAPPLQ